MFFKEELRAAEMLYVIWGKVAIKTQDRDFNPVKLITIKLWLFSTWALLKA